jgi:hypothetical protein
MDVFRKLFKRNGVSPEKPPKIKAALVHREAVVVDIPRPQRNARRLDS